MYDNICQDMRSKQYIFLRVVRLMCVFAVFVLFASLGFFV